jgi:hypothetical protein
MRRQGCDAWCLLLLLVVVTCGDEMQVMLCGMRDHREMLIDALVDDAARTLQQLLLWI